jgi:hypothetical protein
LNFISLCRQISHGWRAYLETRRAYNYTPALLLFRYGFSATAFPLRLSRYGFSATAFPLRLFRYGFPVERVFAFFLVVKK